MRILVIDDDPSVGAAIRTLLNRQGCEVILVESGPLGIRALGTSSFDAVMVDIFMPGMDGLETIKILRQRAPNVPIIAMSGFRFRASLKSAPDFLGMAVAFGASGYLRKPFGPQQLMAAISDYFDEARPKRSASGS